MRRLPNATKRLMLALLTGIVAVPITSTALFIRQEIAPQNVTAEQLRESALSDRSRLRAQRRLYWQVIEKMESGKIDIEKPDVNNTAALNKAMENSEGEEERNAAAEEISLTARDLVSQDRLLLRRYTKAGFCPESLKSFRIPGFYGLCVSLVGSAVKSEPVVGLLNHSAYLHKALRGAAPDISAFKLRMQMIDQANDRSTRKEDTAGHLRPTTCVMNPLCRMPRYSN